MRSGICPCKEKQEGKAFIMVEVYLVKINAGIDSSLINKVMSCLSAEKRNRVGKFRKEDDARRSITSELLVRSLAMNKLNLNNSEIAFGENAYKKPFLKSASSFEFNVSHSGDWVVCAIDTEPVGIDVEQIKPIEFDIAKNFFTAEEYRSLTLSKPSEQLPYFYELWTLKESYIKAVGIGLSLPLDSFSFRKDEVLRTITVEEGAYPLYYLQTIRLESNYVLSVCSVRNDAFTPIVVQEDALMKTFVQA